MSSRTLQPAVVGERLGVSRDRRRGTQRHAQTRHDGHRSDICTRVCVCVLLLMMMMMRDFSAAMMIGTCVFDPTSREIFSSTPRMLFFSLSLSLSSCFQKSTTLSLTSFSSLSLFSVSLSLSLHYCLPVPKPLLSLEFGVRAKRVPVRYLGGGTVPTVERRKIMRMLGTKVIVTPKGTKGTGMVRKPKSWQRNTDGFLRRVSLSSSSSSSSSTRRQPGRRF